jgi:hypothetical protein
MKVEAKVMPDGSGALLITLDRNSVGNINLEFLKKLGPATENGTRPVFIAFWTGSKDILSDIFGEGIGDSSVEEIDTIVFRDEVINTLDRAGDLPEYSAISIDDMIPGSVIDDDSPLEFKIIVQLANLEGMLINLMSLEDATVQADNMDACKTTIDTL